MNEASPPASDAQPPAAAPDSPATAESVTPSAGPTGPAASWPESSSNPQPDRYRDPANPYPPNQDQRDPYGQTAAPGQPAPYPANPYAPTYSPVDNSTATYSSPYYPPLDPALAGGYAGYAIETGGSSSRPLEGPRTTRTIVLAAILAAVIGGGIGAGTVAAFGRSSKTISSGIVVTTATAKNAANLDGTITAAAAKIQPSVVTINVAGPSESGTGSGVILRSDGYILTNNHVVAVAGTSGKIQVITAEGRSAEATIVGTDPSDDLAVIKVGLSNLTAAQFAKSSALQVGQAVVAIGAPLGLSNTVTAGIVSNTARPVQTRDTKSQAVFDAIQTDAAINPGNSGGPLVNLNGDVVGIAAAIASANSGGVQVPGQTTQTGSIGIGFAIPADEASRIAAELITKGSATHAVMGVAVASSSQTTSITTVGATISTVTAGGAAAKAGLQAGDVVVKVQNQLIVEQIDLVAAVRSYAPGTTVTVTYTRAGASRTAQVTLGTAAS